MVQFDSMKFTFVSVPTWSPLLSLLFCAHKSDAIAATCPHCVICGEAKFAFLFVCRISSAIRFDAVRRRVFSNFSADRCECTLNLNRTTVAIGKRGRQSASADCGHAALASYTNRLCVPCRWVSAKCFIWCLRKTNNSIAIFRIGTENAMSPLHDTINIGAQSK